MKPANATMPAAESADAAFDRRLAAVTLAVDDYHGYLLDYLRRLTRQWQDAENLLQDLWQHVLLHFDEDKICALPLLRRKAYQLFIDHYRRQKRRGEVITDELPDQPAAGEVHSLTDSDEIALRVRFWAEYQGIELTDPQKEALWLHARYGYTFKEIETMMEVPASTIGDWLALGRKRLAEHINHEMKGRR